MKVRIKMKKPAILAMTLCLTDPGAGLVQAEPSTPSFYVAASKIKPEGALGQIVS
jgi:hypothetical protein